MDSSLPVLVSRLPDRRALTLLVRAALRHEVATVELATGPQRAEAHALDLHVAGEPAVALLAEPVGAPQNGRFPLRLRPLYRAQAAQLYALLEAENVAIDGPTPIDFAPAQAAPRLSLVDLKKTASMAPLAQSGTSPPSQDPRKTAPLASAADPRRTMPSAFDPRRTAPLAWRKTAPLGAAPPAWADQHRPGASDAEADDASLSVSVVFEPDVLPAHRGNDDVPASSSVPDTTPPTELEARQSDAPHTLVEPASRASRQPASDRPEGAFFDDALANLPTEESSEESSREPVSSEAESFNEVADDEVELVDEASGPVRLHGDEDDTDNDATLVRPAAMAPKPRPMDEPIVRPEARDRRELTPTAHSFTHTPNSLALRAEKSGGALGDSDDGPETQDPPSGADTGAHASRPSLAPRSDEVDDAPSRRSREQGDALIGRRMADGKYIIESLIGSGATGSVYRATHRELRRTVAIKILHPHYQTDPQFMTSFRGEALAASQLDHPNVMRVLDFDQEPDGLIYIVMEYLSGRTLQNLLDEERRLPTERAVEVMIQVCAALSVAHDHGIIHRDIKPDNIMLVPSRNDEGATFELVKVCDFGIAALQNARGEDADLAEAGRIIAGTPEYMSPEQARGGNIDPRSDVYSCGICLYELVTGRPPFLGDHPGEILIKQLEEAPKPPSTIVKGLDPIIEEIILRAIQKAPSKRHQSAREMRVELKELLEPGDSYEKEEDELSVVKNVPMLDDPASGFPGFFIAFSSAVLRFGRFERGHTEAAQAMKELQKQARLALRGRSELTFARRGAQQDVGLAVMSGTAEIVDLRRLLGSQLMGSFGEPFIDAMVGKGIASLTLREGLPETELHYLIEMLLGPFGHEELRKELFSKPLRHVSVLFVSDVVGRDRKLAWKVGLCASRLARDLRALCNVRGISLKKVRETRDELVGGVARLLTRGDEVKQFILNADLVDEAVANLRGFSSFSVAPLIIERVLHESCVETASILLFDIDSASDEEAEALRPFLRLFAQRLVTERSAKSDAAVAEFYRREILTDSEIPRDLRESMEAQSLADALVREPSQYLLSLDRIGDQQAYARELVPLEAAMATLARRAEASALLAVMSTLARHAQSAGRPGWRESAALRTMKSMLDKQRLLPIATALLGGPTHQREAARQLIVLAGSSGVAALYEARKAALDPAMRPAFIQIFRETGPAGWALLAQVLPQIEVRDDADLALVEDLLRAGPDRADAALGEAVAKFLPHPVLRPTALTALVPLWGERARKPLVDALEYAEEPTRIVALSELRRLRAVDDYVVSVIERFLTTRGSAGDELRAAAAATLTDVGPPLRPRTIQLLSKAVEGKRGLVAMLRGSEDNESIVVMEAMSRALLALDRVEGIRALKARLSRSDGLMKQRLTAILQMA